MKLQDFLHLCIAKIWVANCPPYPPASYAPEWNLNYETHSLIKELRQNAEQSRQKGGTARFLKSSTFLGHIVTRLKNHSVYFQYHRLCKMPQN